MGGKDGDGPKGLQATSKRGSLGGSAAASRGRGVRAAFVTPAWLPFSLLN